MREWEAVLHMEVCGKKLYNIHSSESELDNQLAIENGIQA